MKIPTERSEIQQRKVLVGVGDEQRWEDALVAEVVIQHGGKSWLGSVTSFNVEADDDVRGLLLKGAHFHAWDAFNKDQA